MGRCGSQISKSGLKCKISHLSQQFNKNNRENRFRGLTRLTDHNEFGMEQYKWVKYYILPLIEYSVKDYI